jgi:hypothetical protein
MADNLGRRAGMPATMGFLLGAAVAALAVLGYFYYEHTQKEVVRIDVPGFSGKITTDKN